MNLHISDPTIRVEPILEHQFSLLLPIYAGTRSREMELVPHWSEEMKTAFIQQQFWAQHNYYSHNYQGGEFLAIKKEDEIIGRLYIHKSFQEKEIRIIDITLLSTWQNRGIGSGIFEDLKKESIRLNRPLTIHVESFNPAKRLYERLGFKKISETNGVYHLMQWKPSI